MITSIFNDEIKRVIQSYDIGRISKAEVLKGGLINKTFYVKNIYGKEFVIQKLHQMLKKKLMYDIDVITQHLLKRKWDCPRLLRSRQCTMFYERDDSLWRVYEYVNGISFSQKHISKSLHRNVGLLLGLLHKDLADLHYKPKHILNGFHQKNFYIQKAISINKSRYTPQLQNILGDTVNNLEKYFDILSEKQQIIHGDPRIENILFTKQHAPLVFIDYDTFMIGSIYIDIGDCLRSLLSLSSRSDFKKATERFLTGYNSANSKTGKVSYVQVVSCIKYVTLELCLRFIIDSVEQSYFSWDNKKYASQEAHNEARALETWNFFNKLNQTL